MTHSIKEGVGHVLLPAPRDRRFMSYQQILVFLAVAVSAWASAWHSALMIPFAFGCCLLSLLLIFVLNEMTGRVKRAEQLVHLKTAELDLARQEISNHLTAAQTIHELNRQTIQQIADGASHELLTPLRSISGFTKFLQDEYRDRLGDQGIEYIQQIISSSDRMRTLVLDLLNYSRVESQAPVLNSICLNELFDKVLTSLRSEIEEAEGIVTRDDLPIVHGDMQQLAQLFLNLLSNSLKYRGEAPVRIHVSATLTNAWSVAVRDNGMGIDKTFHHQVFDIFRRLHSYAEYPGTGIGLALCRRIVQRHGGRIRVESEPGQGCALIFTIPKSVDAKSSLQTGLRPNRRAANRENHDPIEHKTPNV